MNNLSIGDYYVIVYIIIGIILTIYWWFDEYKADYEETMKKGECEKSMVILLWLFTTYMWPVVLYVRFIGRNERRRYNQFREFQERNRTEEIT